MTPEIAAKIEERMDLGRLNKSHRPAQQVTYFEKRVKIFLKNINFTKDCWEWKGAPNDWGYGHFYVNPRNYLAHRLSYIWFVGEIPPGMLICHKCDNPICVNPDHLFSGTWRTNVRDMADKKRNWVFHGEKNKGAKLTVRDVELARKFYQLYPNCRALSDVFGVNHTTMARVIAGKTWKLPSHAGRQKEAEAMIADALAGKDGT
jgi:hypothetical protein